MYHCSGASDRSSIRVFCLRCCHAVSYGQPKGGVSGGRSESGGRGIRACPLIQTDPPVTWTGGPFCSCGAPECVGRTPLSVFVRQGLGLGEPDTVFDTVLAPNESTTATWYQ